MRRRRHSIQQKCRTRQRVESDSSSDEDEDYLHSGDDDASVGREEVDDGEDEEAYRNIVNQ